MPSNPTPSSCNEAKAPRAGRLPVRSANGRPSLTIAQPRRGAAAGHTSPITVRFAGQCSCSPPAERDAPDRVVDHERLGGRVDVRPGPIPTTVAKVAALADRDAWADKDGTEVVDPDAAP